MKDTTLNEISAFIDKYIKEWNCAPNFFQITNPSKDVLSQFSMLETIKVGRFTYSVKSLNESEINFACVI